jgi:hypothetical protein
MSARAATRRARFVGAALLLSLSATTGYAEPPHDALKMRNAPRASAALTTLSQIHEPAVAKPQEPAAAQPAAPAAVEPAKLERATKEATEVLELCYELARRSDKALRGPITVQAGVRADGSVELRAQGQNLGNGYFARCVERKLSVLAVVSQLPEANANTRMIVVGGPHSMATR